MDEKAIKRRSWVKNIAIIFLLILLVLTFFSNTIQNFSLPQVSAQYPQSGTITSQIRVTGTVEAADSYSVKLEGTRTILSVLVAVGDVVEVGQELFKLKGTESDELVDLRKKYESELLNFKQKELDAYDDSVEKNALVDAQTELAKTKSSYKKLGATSDELEAKIKEVEAEIKNLTKEISTLESSKPSEGNLKHSELSTEERLAAATAAYEDARQRLTSAELALEANEIILKSVSDEMDAAKIRHEDAQKAYDDYSKNNTDATAPDSFTDRYRKLQELEKNVADAQTAYIDAASKAARDIHQAELEYKELVDGYDGSETEAVKVANLNAHIDRVRGYQLTEETARDAFDAAVLALEHAYQDFATEINDYNVSEMVKSELKRLNGLVVSASSALTAATRAHDEAQKAYDESKKELEKAQAALTEAETTYEALSGRNTIEIIDAKIDTLEQKKEAKDDELEDLQELVTEAKSFESEIKVQTKAVESARSELLKKQNSETLAGKKYQLEREADLKALEEMEAEIKKLEENSVSTTITADIAGRITTIYPSPGDTITAGNPIADIFVEDKGYTSSFKLTAEQASRVRVGDMVGVTYWWGNTPDVRVIRITDDPSSGGRSKNVTLSIYGSDIYVGQSMTFTLGERGTNYDTIVPNSAIREDSNGKFILIVHSKSSPLGTRYTARRIDITILAADDTKTAISGLDSYEFVITTSTLPISDGMMVRLAE